MNKKIIVSSILGIAAAGLNAPLAEASETEKVMCHGVSTKWVNDCGANGHTCSGKAECDFNPAEWLFMTPTDCEAVKNALNNAAVKEYVLRIRNESVAASMNGKEF